MVRKSISEATKQKIRAWREKNCFPIINRGSLWYNTLTPAQIKELDLWYKACLDAPETGIIPKAPFWLK